METFIQFYEEKETDKNIILLRNTFSSVWKVIKKRGEIIWIDSHQNIFPEINGTVYVSCSFTTELDYLEKWMKIRPDLKFIVGGPSIQYLNYSNNSLNFYPEKKQMYELLNVIPNIDIWDLEIPNKVKIDGNKKISYIYSLAFGNKCYWGKCNFCDKSKNVKDFNVSVKEIQIFKPFYNHVFLVKLALTSKDILNLFPNFRKDSTYSFYIRGDFITLNTLKKVPVEKNFTPLIGVEFPSDRMLKNMNKGTNVDNLLKTLLIFLQKGSEVYITTIGRWPNLIEKDVDDVKRFLSKIEKYKNQISCVNYVLSAHKKEENNIECSTKYNKFYYIYLLDDQQEILNNKVDKLYQSFGFKDYKNNFSFISKEKIELQKKIINGKKGFKI